MDIKNLHSKAKPELQSTCEGRHIQTIAFNVDLKYSKHEILTTQQQSVEIFFIVQHWNGGLPQNWRERYRNLQQPHKTNHWELSSCVESEWRRRYDYKCVLCVECLKFVFLTIQRWTCISVHLTHYTFDDGASALNISVMKSTLITASVWESCFNILCLVNN